MNEKTNRLNIVIPVMLSFFVMGMVDFVGASTHFAKNDFALDDFTASIIPMTVFLWFAVFSIPTGMLMNRIGRKNTVLVATSITILSLVIPYAFYNFYAVVIAFALLGIGNTILQVSLNPLVASVVNSKKLASTLTFGQFVKAVSSFAGPIIASVMAKQLGDWRITFVIFAIVAALSLVWLYLTPVHTIEEANHQSTFGSTLKLLKNSFIFRLFLGILFIVGIDVGMNTFTPDLLKQRLGIAPGDAALGSSLYFVARTLGAFLGTFLLMKCKLAFFLRINMFVALAAFLVLMFAPEKWLLFAGIFLIGFTCANVFSIIFSIAMQYKPGQTNEISSLMIMGVAGGAVITPIAGLLAKYLGLAGSFGLLLFCGAYILYLSFRFPKR